MHRQLHFSPFEQSASTEHALGDEADGDGVTLVAVDAAGFAGSAAEGMGAPLCFVGASLAGARSQAANTSAKVPHLHHVT